MVVDVQEVESPTVFTGVGMAPGYREKNHDNRKPKEQWIMSREFTPELLESEDMLLHPPVDVTVREEKNGEALRRVVVDIKPYTVRDSQGDYASGHSVFTMTLPEFVEQCLYSRDQLQDQLSAYGLQLLKVERIVSSMLFPKDKEWESDWIRKEDYTPNAAVYAVSANAEHILSVHTGMQKVHESVKEIPVPGSPYKVFVHKIDLAPSDEAILSARASASDARSVWKVNINQPTGVKKIFKRVGRGIYGKNGKEKKVDPLECEVNEWDALRDMFKEQVIAQAGKLKPHIEEIFKTIELGMRQIQPKKSEIPVE